METFIPREKLSKKARRALNLKQRRMWGAINPITRKPENQKAYNRKKVQQDDFMHQKVEPFYYPI
jgi:hypothetical protein